MSREKGVSNLTKEKKNGYLILFEDIMDGKELKDEDMLPLNVIKERIDYCIDNYLKEDEKRAVILRYGLDNNGSSKKMTFKEVGENLGLSQERAREKVRKIYHYPMYHRATEILLNGDEAIKKFEEIDRVCSHLSEFPYKIYDEDKEYIKDHYMDFPLDKTDLNHDIVSSLHRRAIYRVGRLLDDVAAAERQMRLSYKEELRRYISAVISNIVSLNASDIESTEILSMEDLSDIIDRINKLRDQIKANDAEAYVKAKEISESNKERNKILEEEIESLQSMINGKEVD